NPVGDPVALGLEGVQDEIEPVVEICQDGVMVEGQPVTRIGGCRTSADEDGVGDPTLELCGRLKHRQQRGGIGARMFAHLRNVSDVIAGRCLLPAVSVLADSVWVTRAQLKSAGGRRRRDMAPTTKEAQRAELHKTIWRIAN